MLVSMSRTRAAAAALLRGVWRATQTPPPTASCGGFHPAGARGFAAPLAGALPPGRPPLEFAGVPAAPWQPPLGWARVPSHASFSTAAGGGAGGDGGKGVPAEGDTKDDAHGEGEGGHDAGDLKVLLMEEALKHVLSKGWTQAAVIQAAEDLEMSPAVGGLMERGEVELVEFFVAKCNREMAAAVAASKEELDALPLRERLGRILRLRLEMVGPYAAVWPQALALLADPRHAPRSLQGLAMLSDDIWHLAGDSSADATWYTKRAALGALYSAAEVYMLTDFSPGFEDTWSFLDRRLADLAGLGTSGDEVGHYVEAILEGIGGSVKAVFGRLPGAPPRP